MFEEFGAGKKVTPADNFPRIPYAEAMLKYGSDKPDLRNPIEIVDVSEIFGRADVEFKAFKERPCAPSPAPGAAGQPRSFFDKMNEWARSEGAPGLGYVGIDDDEQGVVFTGPIAKFIPKKLKLRIRRRQGQGRRCLVLLRRHKG